MDKMPSRPAVVLGLLLALTGVFLPGIGRSEEASSPNAIKFGVYPYQSPKTLVEMYGPLAVHLEKKLGRKIRIAAAPDAKSFLDKARKGEYDLLLSAPPAYYKLRSIDFKVIARGKPGFYGGAIVSKDSAIKTIEQLKGKKVAAIGEHSYGAYSFILPQLEAKGIDPRKDVDFQFLGKVDSIIYGVVNKKYDAGLIKLETLDLPSFAGIRDQVTVITRSPEIPHFPFLVKSSMDEVTVAAIQEILAALSPDNPEERVILQSMQVEKIVAATDADYDEFFQQIKETDYFREP